MSRRTANEAMRALLSIFDGLAPNRLPLSTDESLQVAEPTTQLTSTAELENGEETAATVAAPPITEETAASLAVFLDTFDQLTQRRQQQ